MRLKPVIFFLAVGGLVALLIFRSNGGGPVRIGQLAPDFAIKDPEGREVRLSQYRGKLVFLNFWATWCAPCEKEMPDLEMMYNSFKERQFEMLAVSVDVNQGDVTKFYQSRNLTIPWFSDPGRQVAGKYSVTGFPETFIIDRNGYLLRHYPGPINSQIAATIEGYLREQEAAEPAPTR